MGLLRLVLALSVVAGHTRSTIFGFNGLGATYAVPVFFTISGFYMAMILNEKYLTLPAKQFYISRALRIFPVYFIGVLLSLLVSHKEIIETFTGLSIIPKLYMVISNLTIFGSDLTTQFCFHRLDGLCEKPINLSINPPGWSLAPELMFYLSAPFVVRSIRKTAFLLSAGCIYLIIANKLNYPLHLFGVATERNVTFVYSFYASSIVFFTIGSLGYHLIRKKGNINYYFSVGIILLLSFTQTTIPSWFILLLSAAIPSLFEITKNIKIDRFIGDLSYPVYILHFPILIFLKDIYVRNEIMSLGSAVTVITLLASIAVYFFVDKRIENFRHSDRVIDKKDGVKYYNRLGVAYVLLYALAPILWVSLLVVNQ